MVTALASQVTALQDDVSRLTAMVASKGVEIVALEEEIARLKGLPPRPKFKTKPSGMEQATSKPSGKKGRKRGRGALRDRLAVTSEVKLKATVPPGSRFRGYEDVLVQDLRISVEVVRYRRERWETATGERIVAALPPGIIGGFGPELRRFLAAGHFQGQVTSERLTALLNGMGPQISKRQIVRLLSSRLEPLVAEDQAMLCTGLETARWISVDDTSARHAGQNGFVTQLGDKRFMVFRTAMSKSRRAFLSLLQAGRTDYVVNDADLTRMRSMALAAPQLAALAQHPAKRFPDEGAWRAHLEGLGFDTLGVPPDPINVATEGALWGAHSASKAGCATPCSACSRPAANSASPTIAISAIASPSPAPIQSRRCRASSGSPPPDCTEICPGYRRGQGVHTVALDADRSTGDNHDVNARLGQGLRNLWRQRHVRHQVMHATEIGHMGKGTDAEFGTIDQDDNAPRCIHHLHRHLRFFQPADGKTSDIDSSDADDRGIDADARGARNFHRAHGDLRALPVCAAQHINGSHGIARHHLRQHQVIGNDGQITQLTEFGGEGAGAGATVEDERLALSDKGRRRAADQTLRTGLFRHAGLKARLSRHQPVACKRPAMRARQHALTFQNLQIAPDGIAGNAEHGRQFSHRDMALVADKIDQAALSRTGQHEIVTRFGHGELFSCRKPAFHPSVLTSFSGDRPELPGSAGCLIA